MGQKLVMLLFLLGILLALQSSAGLAVSNHPRVDTGATWQYLPVVFRRGTITVGEMVPVPASEFTMGCDPEHNDIYLCFFNELPLHAVYLDDYSIDKYEVTNAQYAQCVENRVCTPPADFSSWTRSEYYDNPLFAEYPVLNVDWQQADTYCAWVDKRLPTEAEWEKAARGTNDTRGFPWGDYLADCTLANCWVMPVGQCVGDTAPIGSYPKGASVYGALDIAGNVGEWVHDWFQADYYHHTPYANPQGPATGTHKVGRDGAWSDDSENIQVSKRQRILPETSNPFLGFRCARSGQP
jgi:formylglycine-generating enzyme required for sulfatase activity